MLTSTLRTARSSPRFPSQGGGEASAQSAEGPVFLRTKFLYKLPQNEISRGRQIHCDEERHARSQVLAAAATRRVRVRWPPTPRQSPFSSHFCGIENKAKTLRCPNTKHKKRNRLQARREARPHPRKWSVPGTGAQRRARPRRHGRARLHAALKWRTLFNVSRYKK